MRVSSLTGLMKTLSNTPWTMNTLPSMHMPSGKAGWYSATPKKANPKASFELVVIAVEHRRDRSHVLWKHAQIELRVALLHHAAQQGSVVDTALRFVNGTAIATHFGDMAGHALAFGDQFFAQLVVSLFEDGWLRMGQSCTKETHKDHRGLVWGVHSSLPSKKPLKGRPLSGKKSHEYQSSFLNHLFSTKPVSGLVYLAPAKIQVAKVRASASLKAAWAGMGTGPHLPEPPALMLLAKVAAASF